ncbi:FecR family protein [Pedobacter nutrimenti]|uniref:FecR family protein n=1 Tax=Pedobacter nutrimenti TaxID=1241337 RepID=UPI00292DDE00|nr:FecR domain-containing protein [Pedobacter nutrimenti]
MDQKRITELIEKVYQNKASESEIEELDFLYTQYDDKPGYAENLGKREKNQLQDAIYSRIQEQLSGEPKNLKSRIFKSKLSLQISLVTIAVLLIGAVIVCFVHPAFQKNDQQLADIKPGGNYAVLTLSNGKNIVLTDAKNGNLAKESKTLVRKTDDGQIIYSNGADDSSLPVVYNTLTIPQGGQYTITLSDGTHVIMNSASTLKYPVSFSKSERVVELNGEAYFEVSHDKSKPFKVITHQQVVEVLGTHFNINSYGDDNTVKTVLEEGSVKVYTKSGTKMLKPGQQSVLKENHLDVGEADLEEALAWKNGYFRFNNESIKTIMPRLARWYNIEITFDGNVSDIGFYGTISRSKNISEVLKMLETTKSVHFKIQGRRITVTP